MKLAVLSVLAVLFCAESVFAVVGDTLTMEKSLKKEKSLVFYGGFEEDYNTEAWNERWGIAWNNRADESQLVKSGFAGGTSLRVEYPKGGVGPAQTGCQFPIVLRNIKDEKEGLYQELYLRYYIKFEEGFDFNQGGKLPGLMGGGDSWACSGGHQPNGSNGWTMRFMWRKNGNLVIYAYIPKSHNGKWGGILWGQDLNCNFEARPGTWHCIEEYINVGTPNKDDGALKVWVDGKERLNLSDLCFGYEDNDSRKIGGIFFSTFHGGNTTDWSPRNDSSFVQFDAFTLSTVRLKYVDF